MSETVKLPPLGSFLIDRYLDARYANPDDKLNNIPSVHLAARVIYHISSHAKQFVKLSRYELAEMFSVTDSPIKKVLKGLKEADLISTENNYTVNQGTNRVERTANTITLKPPRADWYLSNDLAVNASASMALFRARKYVLTSLRSKYTSLVFGDSFLLTGKIAFDKFENKEAFVRADLELVRVEINPRMGQKEPSLGSKSTQQIRLTKEIYKELIKNKNLIAFPELQGNAEKTEFKLEDSKHPEKPQNQKETDETNQLTEEPEADKIDPDKSTEDQTMPKYEKVNPSKDTGNVSTDDLIKKLSSNGTTKESYNRKKHGEPLQPTNKKDLQHTVRALNTRATNGQTTAPHFSQISAIESIAKTIAETQGKKQANYTEAAKVFAFAMANYAAYSSFLNPTAKTISPNVSLGRIYSSRYYTELLQFCQKHASKYKAFNAVEWASNSKAPVTGAVFDEKTNPSSSKPPKRASSASQGVVHSGGAFGDLAKEIFGEG
ncbi:DNA binding protein [Vibrio phage vB_VhaS-VHB1]|nr:DNA binding protein [Vibrio phage vB_VhaS-VHB1]